MQVSIKCNRSSSNLKPQKITFHIMHVIGGIIWFCMVVISMCIVYIKHSLVQDPLIDP